jgi:hypothetical protein
MFLPLVAAGSRVASAANSLAGIFARLVFLPADLTDPKIK